MSSWFKNKGQRRLIAALAAGLLCAVSLAILATGRVWHAYDYKCLDFFYAKAVAKGYGPKISFTPRIVYLTITDDSYDFFGKHFLDREDMAGVNDALAGLGPEAVVYDIVFARPGLPESDKAFAESIRRLGSVYLPIGCKTETNPAAFIGGSLDGGDGLLANFLGSPVEKGETKANYGVDAIFQRRQFAEAARGSGDIGISADSDSVYRHLTLLVKIGEQYLPTVSLAVFLDWAKVPLESVVVEWGDSLTIPASRSERLTRDVVVPIDERGRAFVPFIDRMGKDFPTIAVHTLLRSNADEDLRGNLLDIFEGNFVLIGDVSVGISDLGATPLEASVSMIPMHAAMLNGMLTGTFYRKWSFPQAMALLLLVGTLFGVASVFRSSWFLYGTGLFTLAALAALTWTELVRFRLFPVMTVGSAILAIFFGIVVAFEFAVSRERSFIKNTFARYVPAKVVEELLANPETIRLGGEERVATVLFSDLANFTAISEKMPPTDLVRLLNEYLTEMTAIVMENGGIVDKFIGDAIMAEFGVPLSLPDHADRATVAALAMQRRLAELQGQWKRKGLPALSCRIGINTGRMIVGNMGSKDVLDYTVIGDAVNLASRLEGANKRYDTSLMISQFTREHLTPGRFRTRFLDVIRVEGKDEAIRVFEVCGLTGEPVDPRQEKYRGVYNDAFEAYLAREFDKAAKSFGEALSLQPKDLAAVEMLRRIAAIDANDLPRDWDGSVRLTDK